jgi:short-subunit dehydrogenase
MGQGTEMHGEGIMTTVDLYEMKKQCHHYSNACEYVPCKECPGKTPETFKIIVLKDENGIKQQVLIDEHGIGLYGIITYTTGKTDSSSFNLNMKEAIELKIALNKELKFCNLCGIVNFESGDNHQKCEDKELSKI